MKRFVAFKNVAVASLLVSLSFGIPSAAAESYAGDLRVATGCVSQYNGSNTTNVSVGYNSDVNITIDNADTVVDQTVSGPNISDTLVHSTKIPSTSGHNSKTYILNAVTSPVTLTFTPIPSSSTDPTLINDCPTGSNPVAGSLVITPAAAPTVTSTPTTAPAATSNTATPTTTPTATTTTPTTTPTTKSTKTVKQPTSDSGGTTTQTVVKGTKTVNGSNTAANLAGLGFGLILILVLTVILELTGVWHTPKQLLIRAFRRLRPKRA